MRSRFIVCVMCVVMTALVASLTPPVQAQGQQVSITVKGHWAIDVRNPDGTLVSHTEFDNALYPEGAERIALYLTGRFIAGGWTAIVDGVYVGADDGSCYMRNGPTGNRSNEFSGLQVLLLDGQPNRIRLRGSFDATRNGTITRVETQVGLCGAPVTQGSCPDPSAVGRFSGTQLAGIPVAAEQNVQVTVTFIFS